MVTPIITAVLAGALLVLQQLLMLSVGMGRLSETVGVGTNDDPQFERLIRRQGNLAGNTPIFLLAHYCGVLKHYDQYTTEFGRSGLASVLRYVYWPG